MGRRHHRRRRRPTLGAIENWRPRFEPPILADDLIEDFQRREEDVVVLQPMGNLEADRVKVLDLKSSFWLKSIFLNTKITSVRSLIESKPSQLDLW